MILEQKKPRVFVLENVSGLVKIKGGEYYRAILEALEALNTYNIYSRIMDTKEHGIPHSRRRIYFVGINKRHDDGSFSFPEPVARPSIELFLDPPGKRQAAEGNCCNWLQTLEGALRGGLRQLWRPDEMDEGGQPVHHMFPCCRPLGDEPRATLNKGRDDALAGHEAREVQEGGL